MPPRNPRKAKTKSRSIGSGFRLVKKRKSTSSKTVLETRQRWIKRLRPRSTLVKRGQATALGMHLVGKQLRTINASLKPLLLSKTPPFGFGTPTTALDRESELMSCLFELREMIVTLQFHLDMDDVTTLPTYVPVTPERSSFSFDPSKHDYYPLLDASKKQVGRIALQGLVNRFSSAVFSDHHGLVLHAQVRSKPDLNIYYHSLDATHNFSGSTSVRSQGGMLVFTGSSFHSTSLRGAIGFTEQLHRLLQQQPGINVIVLAELGLKDAKALVKPILGNGWDARTNNESGDSGKNDITIMYKLGLESSYGFSVAKTEVGNAAVIVANKGASDQCVLLGCHILNTKAKNATVGKYMKKDGVAALFGDTNISTQAKSSTTSGFTTIESTTSITDSLMLDFSNSAGNKMFDKLLVRTR